MPKKLETIEDVKKEIKVEDFNEMSEKQTKKLYALMPKLDTPLVKDIYKSFNGYAEPLKVFSSYIMETIEKYEKKSNEETAVIRNICISLLDELDKDSKRLFVTKKRKEKYIDQQIQVLQLLTELKKSDDKRRIEAIKNITTMLTSILIAIGGIAAKRLVDDSDELDV